MTRLVRHVGSLLVLLFVGAAPGTGSVPNEQWHLAFLRVDQAHAISRGEGVTVAILDTGVDANHPDLRGSVLPGTDLVTPRHSQDGHVDGIGHGTAMAGLVAAHGKVEGLAPSAKILPIRALPEGLSSDTATDITRGIDWAVDHGAKIINISATHPVPDPDEAAAVNRALTNDVVVVAAAGNIPDDPAVGYPAAYPGVIAVGGVDRQGKHLSTSVSGSAVSISAPASDIASTNTLSTGAGPYRTGTGTSDATAIVSGVVALVRSRFPTLSAAEVVHRLTATADDRGPPGRDPDYGYGIVDPVKALTADVPPLTPSATPVVTPTSIATSSGPSGPSSLALVAIGAGALVVIIGVGWFMLGRRRTDS